MTKIHCTVRNHFFTWKYEVRNSQIQSLKLTPYAVQSTEIERRVRSEMRWRVTHLCSLYSCRNWNHNLYGLSLVLFHLCFTFYNNSQRDFVHRYTYTMQGKKKAFVIFNSKQVKATFTCHLHSRNTINLTSFTKIYSCFPWLTSQEPL